MEENQIDNKTTIYLTEQEVELFLKFRRYQELWEKIFKIKNGSAELHIDDKGNIQKVKYNFYETPQVIH